MSSSSITYSFGNKKYYSKGYGYLSKSSLNKLGVSSSKLAEIAYQESYNYYLSTKNKERAKLSRDNDIIWGNYIEKNIRNSFKNNNGNNPKPPEGNKTLILEKLVKLSIKHFKIGCSLIKNHQIAKGTVHISFSLFITSIECSVLIVSLFPNEVLYHK